VSGLVSVVIPCRNEAKHIGETVQAILNSDYPNVEVLVVDGMSEDGTREVLTAMAKQDPRVRMVDNEKQLTPFAFNLGVQNAGGEFVQIVGSRNVLARDYISILVDTLKSRPDVACVGGDYQHVCDSAQGQWIAWAMESKFGMGSGNYRTMSGNAYVDTVGVPMYRASIFKEIGLFDERLTRNQDDDFNFRVTEKGHKILYVHAAKVTYLVRGSIKKAFWQFFQYGYFKVFVNKKHGAVTTLRQMVPALFIAFWVLGIPFALFVPSFHVVLIAVALVYIFTGLLLAGRGVGFMSRPYVLMTCFILHVGYGLGYWAGVWDFLVTKRPPRMGFQRQTT
jgi:glycosyltransferase involved in cell wall biosynthesis